MFNVSGFLNKSLELATDVQQTASHGVANDLFGSALQHVASGVSTPAQEIALHLGTARMHYGTLMEAAAKGADDPTMARHFANIGDAFHSAAAVGTPRGLAAVQPPLNLRLVGNAAHSVSASLAQSRPGTGMRQEEALLEAMGNVRNGLDQHWNAIGKARSAGEFTADVPVGFPARAPGQARVSFPDYQTPMPQFFERAGNE
jgi:hypothetical protein